MANFTNAKTKGAKLVFCKFIVKNGKKIYPKKVRQKNQKMEKKLKNKLL